MMRDVEGQLRAYAEHLDGSAPDAESLASRIDEPSRGRIRTARARRRPTGLAIATGAAALAVVAVGSLAVLSRVLPREDGSATTSVTAEAPLIVDPSVRFTLVQDDPAFTGGVEGDTWGYAHAGPGAVIHRDGAFHAFRTGSGGDRPAKGTTGSAVGYAMSVDGVVWTEPVVGPLFTEAQVPFADDFVATSAVVLDDGTWVLYFVGNRDEGDPGDRRYIFGVGRATAPQPTGPWTIDPEPVLVPGAGDSWDAGMVGAVSVIPFGDGYRMYYVGGAKDKRSAVGIATSADGAAFEKMPIPVLVAETDGWEDGGLSRADVVLGPEGWVMMFAGRTGGTRGLAFSDDGLAWDRYPANPVLLPTMTPRSTIGDARLVATPERYVLLVQNGGLYTTSDVSVFDHPAPLRP